MRLRDVSLRKRLETERGLFIAEGFKIIQRALHARYQPKSFLLARRWLPELEPELQRIDPDVPVYVTDEAGAEQITGFHVHRGALACFHRPSPRDYRSLLDGRRLVICEDIVDHTNVGAIIRCAAGLGWDGVLLAPRAADPLYRRAIKTSMGASLVMPWARLDDWAHGLDTVREAGFSLVAMALTPDARELDELAADPHVTGGKLAILMGTEGDGLSSRWIGQADHVARIEMSRQIDSLNVAAATAIACYTLR